MLSEKIILLMDKASTAGSFNSRIKQPGYNIVSASAIVEGLNTLRSSTAETALVLIDTKLLHEYEDINDFTDIIKDKNIPVLLLADEDETLPSNTAGFTPYGYISKNSGTNLLNNSIKSALDLHGRFSDNKLAIDESKYKLLVEYASEAIFVAQNNMLKFANPATSYFTGYSQPELYKKPFIEFIYPDDRDIVYNNHVARISGRSVPARYSFRVLTKEGEILWVEINSIAIIWDGIPATLNFLINITDKKDIEHALRKSEDKYRKIFENVQDVFYQTDLNGNIIEISPSIKRYSGFSKSELIGRPVETVYKYPEERESLLQIINEKGEVIDYEIILKDKAGGLIHTSTNSHFLYDVSGKIIGIEGSLRDITERKRAEEELVKSLKQKEVLMMELQHRVKNNLGIISSLLSLEMPKLKDESARAVFMNAKSRIYSMSGIYEQLYNSGNFESVNLAGYINDLAGLIFNTYSVNKGTIVLQTSLEPVELDLRRTVPVGLILNELITNVIKYAYPDGGKGILNINLSRVGDEVTLKVSDNGIGLPENFSISTTDSMGLNLVKMLVEQIRGKLSMESVKGTEIRITFSL